MTQNQLQRLTSEPAVFLLIFISLLLIKLTTNKELGTELVSVYGLMLIGDFLLFSFGSDIESQSGNTAQALLYAGISLVVLFVMFQVVIYIFRQSVLPIPATEQQLTQSVFQTVFQSMKKFGTQEIDLSRFAFFNFYVFGFLVAIQETRVIGRIYGFLARLVNININNFRSVKTWALIILVSLLFMFFHLKVRGVNNNIDLAITFIFASVQLWLIGKFRELESANYMHIGWNSLALFLGR